MSKNSCIRQTRRLLVCGILASVATGYSAVTFAENNATKVSNKAPTVSIPAYVGHNVVSQVEDVRESTGNLVAALLDAGVHFGYADWKKQQPSLKQMQTRLRDLEQRLNRKEELVDDAGWFGYANTATYGTTVHQTVRDLGETLNSIANGMEGGGKTTQKMPISVADDVVDQVEDVNEAVGDLVSTILAAGANFYFYNWNQDRKKLEQYERRIETLRDRLDRKEAAADEEWKAWFGADVYKVTVHDSISELGNIMTGLAASLDGRASTKSSH